ncbi:MAG: BON domain-containing protein [Pseudomonadota bacterium]
MPTRQQTSPPRPRGHGGDDERRLRDDRSRLWDYDDEAAEGFPGGRSGAMPGRGQTQRSAGRADAWRLQHDWDEDRYGYPEATSYRREMSRGPESYAPEGRFGADYGEPAGADSYRRARAWNLGGAGQAGYGGSIDESDYRRWGGEGGRGSGGGYDMAGGYAAMDDYGAEGAWRGDASQGGRGGTTGNPWQARRGRYARQGPKGYARSDQRIWEDVCERLYHADDVDVSDVSVDVNGGTVKLEGRVPERWMKYRIEDICDDALGVLEIDNRIRINRAGPRWQDQPEGEGVQGADTPAQREH